eukprot:Partr_v1_DN28740_c2_g1_i6_m62308 putative Retrotransposon protein
MAVYVTPLRTTPLSTGSDYATWAYDVEVHLDSIGKWIPSPAPTEAIPIPPPARPVDDSSALRVILNNVAPEIHHDIRQAGHRTALPAWLLLKNKFAGQQVYSKVKAISAIANHRWDPSNPVASWKVLRAQYGDLKSAFPSGIMTVENFCAVLALSKLNVDFMAPVVQQAKQRHNQAAPLAPLEFCQIMEELEHAIEEHVQQEALNRHDLPPGKSKALSIATTGKSAIPETDRCEHWTPAGYRGPRKSCWQCFPDLKPAACAKCAASGKQRVHHLPGRCPSRLEANHVSGSNTFIVDSGASESLVANKAIFGAYYPTSRLAPFYNASGQAMPIIGQGTISLGPTLLTQAVHCPLVNDNLLSVSQLDKKNHAVIFADGICSILAPPALNSIRHLIKTEEPNILATAHLDETNLYRLSISRGSQNLAYKAAGMTLFDWHLRFNHLNEADLRLLIRDKLVTHIDFDINKAPSFQCASCDAAKSRSISFPASDSRASRIGEMIHIDFCYIGTSTPSGHISFLTVTDDYSRYGWVFPIISHKQVNAIMEEYLMMVHNHCNRHVSIIRSDNEFDTKAMAAIRAKYGIQPHFNVPHTSQQNGRAEIRNQVYLSPVRAMLLESGLKQYWYEALRTCVTTRNFSPTSSIPDRKTPYELWHGKKPRVDHLHQFGEIAYVHIPPKKRLSKLDPRAERLTFVGYSGTRKAYQF